MSASAQQLSKVSRATLEEIDQSMKNENYLENMREVHLLASMVPGIVPKYQVIKFFLFRLQTENHLENLKIF